MEQKHYSYQNLKGSEKFFSFFCLSVARIAFMLVLVSAFKAALALLSISELLSPKAEGIFFFISDILFVLFYLFLARSCAVICSGDTLAALSIGIILLLPKIAHFFHSADSALFYPLPFILIPLFVFFQSELEKYFLRALPPSKKRYSHFLSFAIILFSALFMADFGFEYTNVFFERIFSSLDMRTGILSPVLISFALPFCLLSGMFFSFFGYADYFSNSSLLLALFSFSLSLAGISFALFVKAKKRGERITALLSSLLALFCGVYEPSFFSLSQRLKRPVLHISLCSSLSCLLFSVFGVLPSTGFNGSLPSLFSLNGALIPLPLTAFLLTVLLSLFIPFALTLALHSGSEGSFTSELKDAQALSVFAPFDLVACNARLLCPVGGTLLFFDTENSEDGKNLFKLSLMPDDGRIFSPFEGTVSKLSDSSIELASDRGCAFTLLLKSKCDEGITFFCLEGERIEPGDLIAVIDIEGMEKKSLDSTVQLLIESCDDYNTEALTPGSVLISGTEMLKGGEAIA